MKYIVFMCHKLTSDGKIQPGITGREDSFWLFSPWSRVGYALRLIFILWLVKIWNRLMWTMWSISYWEAGEALWLACCGVFVSSREASSHEALPGDTKKGSVRNHSQLIYCQRHWAKENRRYTICEVMQ